MTNQYVCIFVPRSFKTCRHVSVAHCQTTDWMAILFTNGEAYCRVSADSSLAVLSHPLLKGDLMKCLIIHSKGCAAQ